MGSRCPSNPDCGFGHVFRECLRSISFRSNVGLLLTLVFSVDFSSFHPCRSGKFSKVLFLSRLLSNKVYFTLGYLSLSKF